MKRWYETKNPKPGFGDEFFPPTVLLRHKSQEPVATLRDNDAAIFFNFRPDRARQLTQALTDTTFDSFERQKIPRLSCFVCMTPYSKDFDLPTAFRKQSPERILPEILAEQGMKQFRVAETEKYAHVTYFFNGGQEHVFPGEDRKLIPSNREVKTYDQAPEMRAREIAEEATNALRCKTYGFFVVNFANPDMVGHTGKKPAIIQALEVIDHSLGEIVGEVLMQKGIVIITADHGNCEEMVDKEGNPHTQHSLNPVPFILIGEGTKKMKLRSGRLCDVAPTILELLKIEQPEEMTGESLIVH